MSNQGKSIHIIKFWERKLIGTAGLRHSFCVESKRAIKSNWSVMSTSGVDEIPTQNEEENALEGDTDLDKKIIKLGESNKFVYENLMLFRYQFLCWESCAQIGEECKK